MQTIDRIFPSYGTNSTSERSAKDVPPSTGIVQIARWRLGKASTWVDLSLKGAALALLLLLLVNFQQNRKSAQQVEREALANSRTLNHLLETQKVVHVQNQRSIEDRKHLNAELNNARQSLMRLEKAVKTGQYP